MPSWRRHARVDFCAGAGGKTLAVGAQMANKGRIYAFDIAEKRNYAWQQTDNKTLSSNFTLNGDYNIGRFENNNTHNTAPIML